MAEVMEVLELYGEQTSISCKADDEGFDGGLFVTEVNRKVSASPTIWFLNCFVKANVIRDQLILTNI